MKSKFKVIGVEGHTIGTFKTKEAVDKFLALVRAKPDGPCRQFALKYTVKEVTA